MATVKAGTREVQGFAGTQEQMIVYNKTATVVFVVFL